MKIALFLIIISSSLSSLTINEIEASINEASKSFEIQKEEQNITKLLEISKILYGNNEKIKELKTSLLPKLELFFDGEERSDFQTGDTLHVKAITRHKPSQMYEKSILEFKIFENDLLLGDKKIELFQSNVAHEEKLSFKILKPSNHYKICAIFTEDSTFQECKIFSASGENIEEKREIKEEVKAPPKPQPIPMPKIEPKSKQTEEIVKPRLGDIKDETFNDRGVIFHYKARFDRNRWIRLDGPFKGYYDFSKRSTDEWNDELAIKGALAIEGNYKNGKFHGEITTYYGDGKIKSIEHFNEGKIIQNNMSYFYLSGKTKEIRNVLSGNIIQASWKKDGTLWKLHESTKNGYINLTDGYKISSKNLKNQPTCTAEFSNNHISKIICYHEDGSVLGFKSFGNNQIDIAFYPKGRALCTNRLNNQGNINRCADDIELQFMKKHDEFVKNLTLMKSGGYIKHLIFSHLATSIGEGVYYAVYNSILDRKLFMHSNPTQKCSFLSDSIKRQFVEFDKRVQNKFQLFLRAKDNSFDINRKMIMQEFAKIYYPHQKQNNDCHNEVVNFYKQMGYL